MVAPSAPRRGPKYLDVKILGGGHAPVTGGAPPTAGEGGDEVGARPGDGAPSVAGRVRRSAPHGGGARPGPREEDP